MKTLINKIVERLYRRDVSFSRNKNFEAYQDDSVRRAARIFKHLKSVEADLLAFGHPDTVSIRRDVKDRDDARILLTIESLHCRRTAYLRPFELALLQENPALTGLLTRSAA